VSIWAKLVLPTVILTIGALIACAATGHWVVALFLVPSAVTSIYAFRWLF
jgi:hypothetical protein